MGCVRLQDEAVERDLTNRVHVEFPSRKTKTQARKVFEESGNKTENIYAMAMETI